MVVSPVSDNQLQIKNPRVGIDSRFGTNKCTKINQDRQELLFSVRLKQDSDLIVNFFCTFGSISE